MNDLKSRADIEMVLSAFYTKVLQDEVIGHFFTRVVKLDLQKHLPLITDFWEAVLFNTQGYRKNVMEVHQHIHQLEKIEKKHLDHWVRLFTQTVEAQFAGEKATLLKQRAISIATLMDIKLNQPLINKKS
jgi:hemoglobin